MSAAPSDTQHRLLAAIAARLPAECVRELYLFAPIRQGGIETGIAVVAAGELPPASADAPPLGDDLIAEALSPGTVEGAFQTPELLRAVMEAAEAAVDAGDGEDLPVTSDPDASAAPPVDLADELEADPDGDAPDQSPRPAGIRPEGTRPRPGLRFTVYTARYRLQLKGPERGRWEVDIVEEADAPLLTVDAVVRGVQRRSGDTAEVERLTGDELGRLLAGRA